MDSINALKNRPPFFFADTIPEPCSLIRLIVDKHPRNSVTNYKYALRAINTKGSLNILTTSPKFYTITGKIGVM